MRPRIIAQARPQNAAAASLRQSAAVGENYLNELLTAADSEDRHVLGERALYRGKLEGGAPVLGLDCRVPCRLPEERRVDVKAAARDDQAVDPVEIVRSRVGIVRQQNRQPAGAAHRVAIILTDRVPRKIRIAAGRLVIEGETDDRLCHSASPIETGSKTEGQ